MVSLRRRTSIASPIAAVMVFAVVVPALAQVDPQGDEFRANVVTTGLQARPRVAHRGDGTFVVVWSGAGEDDATGIVGRLFSAGGSPESGELAINSTTPGDQSFPAVSADASGVFVVAWVDTYNHDGDGWGVFAQRMSAEGAPLGSEFQVNTYTTGDQYDVDVDVAPDGSFVVVWESAVQDGDASGIFAQRFGSDGDPLGGEFQVNTYTTSYQDFPEVDLRDNGNFVVVWTGSGRDDPSSDTAPGVYAQRFDAAGVKLGTEFQVNQFTTGYQQAADVGVQSDGGFVVTWMDGGQLPTHTAIVARRYAANGNPLGDEFVVDTDTAFEKAVPRVAMGGDDSFTVVWTSDGQDGAVEGIYAQHFDAAGDPSGDELLVNTVTANSQSRPAVSADDTGSVVVAWEKGGSAPTEADVSVQRYETAGGTGGVCGDPVAFVAGAPASSASAVTASDALFALRSAVGLSTCELCVCDVDGNGSVAATDALAILRIAVGQALTPNCPAC